MSNASIAKVSATVSVNASGAFSYAFNNAFDFAVNLGLSSGVAIADGALGGDDAFYLQASSSDTVSGGAGNDTFYVAASASDLAGNALRGGAGVDVVRLLGSNATIDLSQGSSNIEAVVAKSTATGETVALKLGEIAGSALTGGGAGPGKAFVALIGADGQVDVSTGGLTLIGEVDAAGHAFSVDGVVLDAGALTAQVTRIDDVSGTLVADAVGASPARQAAALGALNAYIFSNGSTSYTIWTDGQVNVTGPSGSTVTGYQPSAVSGLAARSGSFTQFTAAGAASATLGVAGSGAPTLQLHDGGSGARAVVTLAASVSGAIVRGDQGANGGDTFLLGKSGGANQVIGSVADDVFDLQTSTGLADVLNGGGGFDLVRATADGADVDLTANTTGGVSRSIEGVVSGAGSTSTGATQTVELDPNTLTYAQGAGAKTAQFAALLGGSGDTVTLEGGGVWLEVASFAPGAAPPKGAVALAGAADLDAAYGGKTHTAENALTGYVFESVGAKGVATKYLTLYTDATVDNQLAAPSAALMAQALAQYGAAAPGFTAPALQGATTPSALIAPSHNHG